MTFPVTPSFVRATLLGLVVIAGVPAAARAEALLLIEADSGKVLQAENATMPWYPASTSKLMTTYVTLSAVRAGRLTLDTLVTVSPNAVAQAPSKMGFRAGTQLTVDNALKMLLVKSANDMAVVLAEGVSGSIEKFADEMNLASQRLGMTQSSWVNPNGLPDERQISSARDMAILARALIRDFPEYDFYWHIPAIRLGRKVMRNYNTLIDRYPGADGMKTGFICSSGFNLVASATRNNRRLIAVVFGAPSGPVRAAKAAGMLEHGFNTGGLSWLRPSQGTVESLVSVNVDPPDLREQMCGKHRRRPAAEEADNDEDTNQANGDAGSQQGFLTSGANGAAVKPSTLIGPLVESQPPIPVFVGAPKGTATASAPAEGTAPRPAKKKKPAAAALATPTAAKPATVKPAAAGSKPAALAKPVAPAKPKPAAPKADGATKGTAAPPDPAAKPKTATANPATAKPAATSAQ